MVSEIQIMDVIGIQVEDIQETDNNVWREIEILTKEGPVTICLYAHNQDHDYLKIKF